MLYIMRHGITDWNKWHKLQGRTDIPLNEEGRQMARVAAKECADVHFDVCYCSPLVRALETAEIVLESKDVPIITDDRLMEMSFGEYEGIENSFQIPDCPINVFFKEPENYITPVPQGESMDELFGRTGEFLEEIVEPLLAQGKDVLIVGHGAMNSSIICRIRGLSRKHFWDEPIKNCKLIRLA